MYYRSRRIYPSEDFEERRMTGMRLLIVNDEDYTADAMCRLIPWAQYGVDQVSAVYGAESAREVIRSGNVDIILCDIEMPGESGLSLLEWIRTEQYDIECVFLTCHASFVYAKEAIRLDCQDYVVMPAKYEEIGASVEKVVRRIQEKKEAKRYEEYGKNLYQEKVKKEIDDSADKRTSDDVISEMISFIRDNLGNPELSVNMLSAKLYLHPVYMNRMFKKNKGITVSQYINGERMRLAKELLDSQKISATAVAEKVGYTNYSSFHIAYKKYYGYTPSGKEV